MSFYTFPLCALALTAEPDNLMHIMVNYSTVRLAESLKDRMSADELRAEAGTHENPPKGADNAIIVATGRLGIINGNCAGIRESAAVLENWKAKWESKHGRDASVSVGHDFIWGLNRGETEMIDFRIISAINSLCGHQQTPRIIRRDMIQARMVGCKSVAVQVAERARCLLTVRQLRTKLDSLQARGLITRVPASRRNTWFAPGPGFEALLDFVAAKKKRSVADLMAQARARLATR